MDLIDCLVYTKMLARYLQVYGGEYSESSLDCLYELFLKSIPTENIPAVLEIGGGCFPAFSKYFDEFQREHNMGGTITTYDSRLITNKLGNIKLHKENLYEDMSVQSYDLIVGIMPCDAKELIVKKATLEHKEFFIAMCGCTHYDGFSIPQGAW